MAKLLLLALALALVVAEGDASRRKSKAETVEEREGKLLSMFQIVRFPNDGCAATNSKNGTCYTADECKTKSGTSSGTCAEGYGVCCTFAQNCGVTSSENNTYFENTGSEVGACTLDICKSNPDICQLRLDFENFVINGPATTTLSSGLFTGIAYIPKTRCLTDSFSVTSPGNPSTPVICGNVAGEHMYVDASESCNQLAFSLGTTSTTMRQWSIKVTQYSCSYENLAPSGCTQYYFGNNGAGSVKTFNFDGGLHLAEQNQKFCFRQESNRCRICYAINAMDDFQLSGKTMAAVMGKESACCGYGPTNTATSGYDCLVIPQVSTIKSSTKLTYSEFCGSKVTFMDFDTANMGMTVCSKKLPFDITFLSDNFEFGAADELANLNAGFKLDYFQTNC